MLEVIVTGQPVFSLAFGEQLELEIAPSLTSVEFRSSGQTIGSGGVEPLAGAGYSAVLTALGSGGSTVRTTRDDAVPTQSAESQFVIRNFTAGVTLDVLVAPSGSPLTVLAANISSGRTNFINRVAGRYDVALADSGSGAIVAGPNTIDLRVPGSRARIYAIGGPGTVEVANSTLPPLLPIFLTLVQAIPRLAMPVTFTPSGGSPTDVAFGSRRGPARLESGVVSLTAIVDSSRLDTVFLGPPGASRTAAVFQDGAGVARLRVFDDDFGELAPTMGRIVIRHLALAPSIEVDIRSSSQAATLTTSNGETAHTPVPEGNYSVTIREAGNGPTLITPFSIPVRSNTTYLLHLAGTVDAAPEVSAVVHSIDLSSRLPVLVTRRFGTGCGTGTLRVSPDQPRFETPFNASLENACPSAVAALLIGRDDAMAAGIALPAPLNTIGAPNCFLLQDSLTSVPTTTDSIGNASIELWPRFHEADDAPYFVQFVHVASGLNPLGVALTDAVSLRRL